MEVATQPWETVVVDSSATASVLRRIAAGGRVAIDTETDGLHWARGNKPFMATICADLEVVYATYDPALARSVLDYVEANRLTQIYHNAKFDLHMLRGWTGYAPNYFDLVLEDSMHAFRIQYPLDSAVLKIAARRFVGEEVDAGGPQKLVKQWLRDNTTRERINGKWIATVPTFDKVPPEIMAPYATQDVWMTMRCSDELEAERAKLPEKQAELYRQEVDLVKLLLHSERHGWPVGYDRLMEHLELCCRRYDEAYAALQALAPGLNPASTPQLRNFLYETLGEPVKFMVKPNKNRKKTDKPSKPPGPSTDETALINLNNKEAGAILLDWRHWKRARDKANEIALYMDSQARIHSDFKQERAKTGRFGSSSPAMQNTANPHGEGFCKCHAGQHLEYSLIRDQFVPPEGFDWIFADASQVEMRIFAHYCKDRYLTAAILNGDDLHGMTARRMYGIPDHIAVAKAQRAFGKIMNFTIIYGGGRNKIATALREGSAQNDPLTIEEAQAALKVLMPYVTANQLVDPYVPLAGALLNTYKEMFPDIDTFVQEVQKMIKHRWYHEGQGYVKNVFGRVTPVPVERAYAGTNYIIQGTAADLLKAAMLKSWKACEEFAALHGLTPWRDIALIATIHDELIYQVKSGYAEQLARHLKPVLTTWPMLSLPITFDFAHVPQGRSWATKEERKDWAA